MMVQCSLDFNPSEKPPGTGGAMVRWNSTQGVDETPEGDARTDQFELLNDSLLEEYSHLEDIKGWDLSEMNRPDRKTILRLIRFFSTD